MNKKVSIIYILLVLSCNKNKDSINEHINEKPIVVELNNNYSTNVLTGDSIQTIENSNGEIIQSGVEITIKEKNIDNIKHDLPKIVKTNLPKKIASENFLLNTNNFITKFPSTNVQTVQFLKGTSKHSITNQKGEKIITGERIKIIPRKKVLVQPKSTQALPTQMLENAIYDLQYLDVDQGMNSSYILSIIQDKKGNIWFGTEGGGVSKYDGHSFYHYTENEGLSNNIVRTMIEDKKGNLWFGTSGGGLIKYDGHSFFTFSQKEGFCNDYVMSIYEDSKGNLWLATYGGGVSKFDGNNFTHYTSNEGLCDNYFWAILEDKQGNMWFGSDGSGACKFDGQKFYYFNEKNGLINNYVYTLELDKQNNVWFGTQIGITKFDGKNFYRFQNNLGLNNYPIRKIKKDSKDKLWLASDGGGVACFDDKKIVIYSENEGLNSNNIWAIYIDKQGLVWFGSRGGGATKLNTNSFQHFTKKEGLSNTIVRSICEDKKGNLWFATEGGGLTKFDGSFFYDFSENLSLKNILTLFCDKKGYIWIGTEDLGLVKFDGENFSYYTEKQGLNSNNVSTISEDLAGNLWFGSKGKGVSKYNGQTFTTYTDREGLSSNDIRFIFTDKQGNVWFCTYGAGVSKYNGKSFIHYSEKEGLASNFVWSMTQDKNGDYWFCYDGSGISKFDGSFFYHYTNKSGLSNNYAWSVMNGINNDLFVSTERGLNYIFNSDNELKITTFSKLEGLKGLDFYNNSAFVDSKNRIWLGGGKSLEMLDLKKFKISDKILKPLLTSLEINENTIDFRNLSADLKKEIKYSHVENFENYPINLILPYHKNHLTFYFSAIDWKLPYKIRYQYKMEGLNENWSISNNQNIADYRNLPHGRYTFKVRAIGASQRWSDPFEYTFTISPPWWHTWIFRVCLIIFILFILYLLYRWRTKALILRQKQLEQTVEERTAEVVAEKIVVEQQKLEIEEKHKEITDSINYAERIQRSFLASEEILDTYLKDYFVFFQPKDVVSGDFYWAEVLNNGDFAFSCADSTGHGVPGAIMSILNISSLEKSIEKEVEAHKILNETRKIIIERLKKDGSEEGGKDGMDASLLVINKDKSKLSFALANNPIFIVRNNELIEFKGDKMPVGKHDNDQISFTLHTFEIQKEDVIYSLTDGFQDQFGGEKGKKYMIKNLKELFLKVSNLPMKKQKELLLNEFNNWKEGIEQVDDVCIIGVKI
jgi:ligand-binding sensor domain-containing protein/serine phosphatase RsbU (regulator of sigma subunit)